VRPVNATAPTIDGSIDAGEWSASDAYDVSDVAGRGGTPQPAGSCLACFLYDSSSVYVAVDCPNRTVRVNLDQLGPFMDEDGNGRWSADSSEGGYSIEYLEPSDEVIYRAVLDTFARMWEMGVAPGALSASSLASGHLQFEAKVPIGLYKWQLGIHSGDTVGYFQYTAVDSSRNYIGWWPQAVTVSQWSNPRYYGTMIFDSLASGVRDRNIGVPFTLHRARPSVVRDRADVSYYVDRQADVRLAVYDAAGSLVRTLVSGRVSPGERAVIWDRKDNTGRRVADGTYFYHLVVDGAAVSGKAIVLR
jgi:hypothetical protein